MDTLRYSVIIGYNDDQQYSIIVESFYYISNDKQVIDSIVQSGLTLEECLTIQNEFIDGKLSV
jgi:hypothetical protein